MKKLNESGKIKKKMCRCKTIIGQKFQRLETAQVSGDTRSVDQQNKGEEIKWNLPSNIESVIN